MARKPSPTMFDVLGMLTRLSKAAADCSPAWDELGNLYKRHSDSVFDSHGYGSWNSFASATLLKHRAPLVREGIMQKGMTLAKPRYSDPTMAAYGPPKHDYRVQNVAILQGVDRRDRAGKMVKKRPVKKPLNAAERQQWIAVIRKHLRQAQS